MNLKAKFSKSTRFIFSLGVLFSTPLGLYLIYLSCFTYGNFALFIFCFGAFFAYLGIVSAFAFNTTFIANKEQVILDLFYKKQIRQIADLEGFIEVKVTNPKRRKYQSQKRHGRYDNARLYIYFKNEKFIRLDPHLWAYDDYKHIIQFLQKHSSRIKTSESHAIVKNLQERVILFGIRVGLGITVFGIIGMISLADISIVNSEVMHPSFIFLPLVFIGLGMAFYNKYLNRRQYVTVINYLKLVTAA